MQFEDGSRYQNESKLSSSLSENMVLDWDTQSHGLTVPYILYRTTFIKIATLFKD